MSGAEIVSVIESKLAEKKISKGDFYKACRITAPQMSNWRRNKNYPLLDTLTRINNFLGTDFRIDTKSPAPDEGEAERAEFIRLYEAAPAWLQDQIRALLKAAESGNEAPGAGPKAP